MFKSVTIAGGTPDAGSAAEALVYYSSVNIVANGGLLLKLSQEFGVDNLLRLIDTGALQIKFEQSQYGVVTAGQPRVHAFSPFSLAGSAEGRSIRSAGDEIEHIFVRNLGNSARAKRQARDLAERVVVRDVRQAVCQQAFSDCLDKEIIKGLVRAWLATVVPEYQIPLPLLIDTMDTGQGLAFGSNLNYEEINKYYHRRIPPAHSTVDAAFLLANVLTVRKEIVFGADANSELWLGPGESAMLRMRIEAIAQRAERKKSEIELFHDVEFEGRTFAEVINSGERTPADLIKFLEDQETIKFKEWLSTQADDAHLIKEYDRAVFQKTGWMHKLPFKLSKMVGFSGAGLLVDATIGTMGAATAVAAGLTLASDVVLSSGDEFVLSKVLRGWKPSQFVEGPAQHFLAGDKKEKT